MSFTTRFIARMEPWNTGLKEGGKTDLERWLTSIAAMFEPVAELVEQTGFDGEAGYVPPWGILFNPETCPFKDLPYLGQFVGVEVAKGANESEAREQVKKQAGQLRGTLQSLKEAIETVIGKGETLTIQERTAEGGGVEAEHFNVIVGVGKKTQALYEAINAVKPVGLWYTIFEASNRWINGTKKWSGIAAGKKWTEMVEPNY